MVRTICENRCRKSWTRSWQRRGRIIKNNVHVPSFKLIMRREEKITVNLFVDPSLLEGSISMDFGLNSACPRTSSDEFTITIIGSAARKDLLPRGAISLKLQKHIRWFTITFMAYASSLLAFPFRSVALLFAFVGILRSMIIMIMIMMITMYLRMSLLVRLADSR